MPGRFAKQLMYGGVYLLLVFLIVYGFYLVRLKPAASCFDNKLNQGEEEVDCGGPCVSCAIRHLSPLVVTSAEVFDNGDRTGTVVVGFRNPNVTYGARTFQYEIVLFGPTGETLQRFTRTSFLYPGEIREVADIGIAGNPSEIARAEARVADVAWEPRSTFTPPQFTTRELHVNTRGSSQQAVIAGILVNRNSFKISEANVTAIVSSKLGVRVAVSKTKLQDIPALGDRSFEIAVPNTVDAENIDERLLKLYIEATP